MYPAYTLSTRAFFFGPDRHMGLAIKRETKKKSGLRDDSKLMSCDILNRKGGRGQKILGKMRHSVTF